MLEKTRGRRIGLPVRKQDLAYGEPERVVDKAYRRSASGRPCDILGCRADPATVVAAHFRITLPGFPGAGGRKPHDGLDGFLCHGHHDQLDGREMLSDQAAADLKNLWLAGLLMERYAAWKKRQIEDAS